MSLSVRTEKPSCLCRSEIDAAFSNADRSWGFGSPTRNCMSFETNSLRDFPRISFRPTTWANWTMSWDSGSTLRLSSSFRKFMRRLYFSLSSSFVASTALIRWEPRKERLAEPTGAMPFDPSADSRMRLTRSKASPTSFAPKCSTRIVTIPSSSRIRARLVIFQSGRRIRRRRPEILSSRPRELPLCFRPSLP